MKRLTLCAGLLAVGASLAACSSDNPTPTPTDASTGTDTPVVMDSMTTETGVDAGTDTAADRATDTAADRVDAGPLCGRLPYTAITRMGTSTTVRGDTTEAWMAQTSGRPTGTSPIRPPSSSTTCSPMSGQVVYSYTVGTMPASLRISTTNTGTSRIFDTVLWVTTRCANTLSAAACNDDDPEYASSPDRRVSSLVTTEVLPAGTQVFIILGGFYPAGDGTTTIDHGAYQLTINELPAVAAGAACDTAGLTNRCDTDLVCVADVVGGPTGRCRTQGSVAGSPCRTSVPNCDTGLTCSSSDGNGVCVTTAMADGPCDPRTACPDGYFCSNTTFGAASGTCRRIGSTLGSDCRPMGSTGGRCDAPLVCSVDVDPSDTSPSCVRAATLGGACDIFRSVCPAGSTCVTANGSTAVGTCTAFGTAARARCRASGTRCDMGLECITVGEGANAEDLCLRRSTTNMACGPALQCPDADTCYLTDLSDRQNGLCGATGQAGGSCNMSAPFCTGSLQCSSATGNGLCSNVSTMMGAACDRLRTRCGTGFSCVLNAGSQTAGTCQPDGSVAGADCRAGDMPCATGLTCSSSALSGGVCQRAATAGMACDPLNGSTRCPAMQYCLATAYNAGTCTGGAVAEMEPNDNPSNVMARPVTAATLVTGALGRFDVDCVAVTVPAMGRIVANISDGNGRCPVNIGGRIAMDIYSADGTTIRGISQQNGPFGVGSCSNVDGGREVQAYAGNLAAGTYYVCVRGVNDAANGVTTTAVASYVLSVNPLAAR